MPSIIQIESAFGYDLLLNQVVGLNPRIRNLFFVTGWSLIKSVITRILNPIRSFQQFLSRALEKSKLVQWKLNGCILGCI